MSSIKLVIEEEVHIYFIQDLKWEYNDYNKYS